MSSDHLSGPLRIRIAQLIQIFPLLALQCSSAAMSGGVGTASAFGPIFEEWGAPDATVVGVAAGTMGNIMGSLIGGPVAAFLIAKHGLKSDPNDKPEAHATGRVPELNNTKMIMMFAMCLLLAALGMPIYCLLDNIPMIEMPKFIGCLFAGAIARNVMEATGIKFYVPEVDAIEHMFLELYLALVLMTTDFSKLAPLAGQMGIILVAQGIFMALFGIFVSFNLFGRDYGAAVMTAGNIGWGCGSGSNAVANEKAIMDQYGWHTIAWVLYPSFAHRYHRRYLQPDLPLHLRKSVPELTEPYNIYWFLICITLFSGRISPLSDRFLFVFLKYIVSATDFMLYSKEKLQKLSGAFSGFTA